MIKLSRILHKIKFRTWFIFILFIVIATLFVIKIILPQISKASEIDYKFEEAQGNTTSTSVGTANTGTLAGTTKPTWQSEDLCISGKCLYFEGTTAKVTLASEFDPKTISFWIKPITVASTALVAFGGTTRIDTDSGGNITTTGFTSPTLYLNGAACTTCTLIANRWQHVTVTSGTAVTGTAIVFGNYTTIFYKGFMDELKMYSTQQSTAQIQADFNSRGGIIGASSQNGQASTAYLNDGLVGYWKMDEASGNPADSSGNAVTLTNNNTATFTAGKFGNAGTFNGSNQYFSTATTISGIQTISFWANPASTTDNYINLTGSTVYINSSSGTITATGVTSPIYYINGVATASPTISASAWTLVTITTNTSISGSQFEVGRANSTVGGNGSKMDDVRLYTRVLSADEIRNLYNWAPEPVGYWNFDENKGTTANDISGNANNGTVTNAVYTPGKFGSALSYNGTSANTQIADKDIFSVNTTKQLTVEAWFNLNNVTTDQYIVSKHASSNYEWHINSDASGFVHGVVSTLAGTDYLLTSSANAISAHTWYHVVMTVDIGTTTARLYLNGQQVGSSSTASGSIGNGTAAVRIGENGDNTNFVNGIIDEVKIYNYVRTQQQIIEDMNGGHPAGGSPIGTQIVYWKLDEQFGTGANSVHNSVVGGSAYNGNNSGAAWLTNATCKVNGCLNFDTSTDNVSAGDVAFVDGLPGFSTSFWINPQTLGTTLNILSKANTSTQRVFQILTDASDNTKIRVMVSSSASDTANYCTTATGLLVGSAWEHLAIVYDGTQATGDNNRIKVYKNAVQTSCTVTGTIPTSFVSGTTSNFKLGKGDDSNNALLAEYDEVKIYNFPLTSDTVKKDYNFGASVNYGTGAALESSLLTDGTGAVPKGYWNFEENTGTTANDISGNANTATLTSTLWGPGKYGSSANFSSSASTINAGSGSTLTNLFSSGGTVEAWVYPKTAGNGNTTGRILDKLNSGSTTGWNLQLSNLSSGNLKIEFTALFSGTSGDWLTSSAVVPVNKWSHIAVTYTSSAGTAPTVYLNGVIQATNVQTTTGTYNTDTGQTLFIGNNVNANRAFDGFIDEAKVFNYARTQGQIAYDYNRGNPVGWWKMNENVSGNSQTLHDSSGNTNTATTHNGANATGMDCTVGGKFNYGCSLDGTDDNITIADTATLRFDASTQDFSVLAWVKRGATGAETDIISKEDADNDGWRLEFVSTNVVRCSVNSIDVDSTITITDTTIWHLVGCTITRAGNGQVYIDGVATGTATAISSTAMATTANITIGARSYTTANYLNGKVDEVRLYNYSLSASQIKQLYDNGSGVFYGPSLGTPIP